MRKVCLVVGALAVISMSSCRPAATPIPNTPQPTVNSISPLPTAIAPQTVPEATSTTPAGPPGTPSVASGVHLIVTIGPTCPGPQRPGQICTRPYQGEFVVTNNAGAEVARATTDQNGKATIDLPPGNYTIASQVEGKFPSSAPATVTVPAGQYVEVNIELDTGIR
jgi:hypothetical protein